MADIGKERVRVDRPAGKRMVRRQVVEDRGRERRALVARAVQIMWLCVTALQALLGVRVLLRLAAANPDVPFARFIYHASAWFLGPFNGLTATPSANGVVFEVPTIIAMTVYVLAGWLLAQLVWLVFKPARHRSIRTYEEIDRKL